jgi:hypothetical protein
MADLTDIDKILEYLATVGISYEYENVDGKLYLISLNCEYFTEWKLDFSYLTSFYKQIYIDQTMYRLLDNLLINCRICDKYVENNYNMHVEYAIYRDKFDLYFKGKYIARFKNIDDLMTYINKNYPEHIRQGDIKIALK